MSTQIYGIDSCTVTIGGVAYPVTGFRLELMENGIPAITVGIGSYKAGQAGASAGGPTVATLKPEDYFAMYSDIQLKCDNRSKASFSFRATTKGPDSSGDVQTLELKDWVCAVSGFTRFSANGGLVFGVTLKHPAYNIYYSVSNLTNLTASQVAAIYTGNQGATPFDILVKYMERYVAQGKKGITASDPGIKKMHEQYVKIIQRIRSTFRAEKHSVPKGGFKEGFDNAIRASVYYYAAHVLMSSNPFKSIVDVFLPEWYLSAKPNLKDNKLVITPLEPWGSTQYTIDITDVSDFNFPTGELEPLTGVYISGYWLTTKALTAWKPADEEAQKISDHSDGVACIADDAALGSIQRFKPPQWAEYSMAKAQGKKGITDPTKRRTPYSDTYDKASPPAEITPTLFKQFKGFMQRICNDTFAIRYKATISMSVIARLMIQYKSVDVLPGCVYDIKDKTKGVRFYVTDVVHTVDVKGMTARTELHGRYVRRIGATINKAETYKSQIYR